MRTISWAAVAAMLLAGCSMRSCSQTPASSQASPSASPSAAATRSPTPGAGVAIALKATAMISFRAGTFSATYVLDSGSNSANSLVVNAGDEVLDLGSSDTQEFRMTVFGGASAGADLSGPDRVLGSFNDEATHQGGIATMGQGVCKLQVATFGAAGMSGTLDCEGVAPLMGSSSPVSFQASIQARPAG